MWNMLISAVRALMKSTVLKGQAGAGHHMTDSALPNSVEGFPPFIYKGSMGPDI